MGIFCQIHINKPQGDYRPRDVVQGLIKYAVDQETEIKNITVSLVGDAECTWKEGDSDNRTTYSNSEKLYKIETYLSHNTACLRPGTYEEPFYFILPRDIPSTYKDSTAKINHYIVIKFERPGMFNFSKKYKTKIFVKGTADTPLEQKLPIICGEKKNINNMFVKSGELTIKATINKAFVKPGDELDMFCSIENTSHTKVTGAKIRLREKITYISSNGHENVDWKNVGDCKTVFDNIKSKSQLRPDFHTPTDIWPIQHTKVMRREYFAVVTARLPMPHWNLKLNVPVNIGDDGEANKADVPIQSQDQPPSYWESMYKDLKEAKK